MCQPAHRVHEADPLHLHALAACGLDHHRADQVVNDRVDQQRRGVAVEDLGDESVEDGDRVERGVARAAVAGGAAGVAE